MTERETNKRFVVRPTVLPLELYYDVYVGQAATSYLETVGEAPWFCWVSFGGPHEPWDTPEPYASLYDPAGAPPPLPRGVAAEDARGLLKKRFGQTSYYSPPFAPGEIAALRSNYAGGVTLIDEQIGHILTTLSRRGLMDDTLVVFTSDHGEMNGDHGLIYKANFLEPTIHIPFIVKPPHAVDGGRETSVLVEQMDIGATMADYAGADLGPEFRGRSVRPVVESRTSAHRTHVLSQFGGNNYVISDRLKIEFAEDGEACLAFDRAKDAQEQLDISRESSYQADIGAARQWLDQTIADAPTRPDAVIME